MMSFLSGCLAWLPVASATGGRMKPQIGPREMILGLAITVAVFAIIAMVARRMDRK